MPDPGEVLARVRAVCLRLPEARETVTFGRNPTFQAGTRTFAVLDVYRGQRVLCFKAPLDEQARLCRGERFFPSPYGAAQGWTCLKTDGRVSRGEIERLLLDSYRLVALKRMLEALERTPRARTRQRAGR